MAARQIAAGGTRGTVFREAALQRLLDSETLFGEQRANGAIYLAGYAIECHLKYACCSLRDLTYLPANLETHSWNLLLRAAGLVRAFTAQQRAWALFCSLVDQWSTALRYSTRRLPAREATQLYKELKELYKCLQQFAP